MKEFLSKRHLIILVSCILLIGVAIPVTTFAKSPPPGEQKKVQSAVRFQAVAGQSTAITADCSAPQPLVTLNKGDILKANATLTSTDSNEQSEGEFLHILNASTTPATNLLTVDNNAGSGKVTFTAKVANDPIQVCIDNIDNDETGSVTFTVTPVPTPVPTPTPNKLPQVPNSISRGQLLRLVGILLTLGGPGLVSTHCKDLLTAKGNGIGGVFYECLSDIHDIIDLVNDGKLFLPFSQFFLFHFQVLQIECQAGIQNACRQLFGTIPA